MGENATASVTGIDVLNVRTALGLTQEQLADAVGVSKKTAYNWESRGAEPIPPGGAKRFIPWAVPALRASDNWDSIPEATRTAIRQEGPQASPHAARAGNLLSTTSSGGAGHELRDELAANLLEARRRAQQKTAVFDPETLADMHLALINDAEAALTFGEHALTLGADSSLISMLATSVVNTIIDTGTLALAASLPSVDVHRRVLERSADLSRKARDARETTDRERKPPYMLVWQDPVESKGSGGEGHDLAAIQGEADAGHGEMPNET